MVRHRMRGQVAGEREEEPTVCGGRKVRVNRLLIR
jgi:hypothetical protein